MSALKFPKLNTVIISGRLTADPELKYTPQGKQYIIIRLAWDDGYYDKANQYVSRPCFIRGTVWSNVEKLNTVLVKGSPVILEGSLSMQSYEKNGQQIQRHELNVEKCQILEKDRQDNTPGF